MLLAIINNKLRMMSSGLKVRKVEARNLLVFLRFGFLASRGGYLTKAIRHEKAYPGNEIYLLAMIVEANPSFLYFS